ncbi:MAG: hypothetical protein CSA66_00390 [Proteobacteria bacterium]|nr:MAG: hypothetical protein CSA66_00390 [Pseudomonadota bacterium]
MAISALALMWQQRATKKLVARARAERDVTPLVDGIARLQDRARPTAFDVAARQLWNADERALAVSFIRGAASYLPWARAAQYWIKHAQEVEPQLTRDAFDPEFLETIYQPRVAQQCGSFG